MPVLRSRLLPEPVVQEGSIPQGAAFHDSVTSHMQRVLLEGVANGSISDAKKDIGRLVRSTLLCQQVDFRLVHCGTVSALGHLRQALALAPWLRMPMLLLLSVR